MKSVVFNFSRIFIYTFECSRRDSTTRRFTRDGLWGKRGIAVGLTDARHRPILCCINSFSTYKEISYRKPLISTNHKSNRWLLQNDRFLGTETKDTRILHCTLITCYPVSKSKWNSIEVIQYATTLMLESRISSIFFGKSVVITKLSCSKSMLWLCEPWEVLHNLSLGTYTYKKHLAIPLSLLSLNFLAAQSIPPDTVKDHLRN